jgi:hypothetical protein
MPRIEFLDLPLTVRLQIYSDILIPECVSEPKNYRKTSLDILYTNRQIYVESSDVFYSKNLFVVVESNDPGYIHNLPKEEVSIFSRNPMNSQNCKRMAMRVDMYIHNQRLPTISSQYFISSLPKETR